MIELQTTVKTSKQDDTTRTRTPKPRYLGSGLALFSIQQTDLTSFSEDRRGVKIQAM